MPVCEGLPSGPCPLDKNDATVVIGKGDLLLCPSCDTERRRLFDEALMSKTSKNAPSRTATTSGAGQQQQHQQRGGAPSTSSTGRGSNRAADNTPAPSTPIVLQVPVVASLATKVDGIKKVVWNELLAYVNVYRQCSTDTALQKVVLTHFSHDDISEAKRLLALEFQTVGGVSQYVTERRNTSVRPAHEAEVDDIIGILDVVDLKHALEGYVFVASNLQAMPKYGPEEINLAVVVDRQVRLDAAITDLSATVQTMASSPGSADSPVAVQQAIQSVARDLQQQLGAFSESIDARLEHLSAVCTQLAESTADLNHRSSSPRAAQQSRGVDRSMNLVLFGVAEDKDASVWRRKVDQTLLYVSGYNVDVTDMFRIGRYTQDKTRPIVVKLRTAWDRRIILSKCNRLKDYNERIFIAADEPVEERRKKIMTRLKSRAEQNGKNVSVVDGVLFIDNVSVFSLKDGKLNHDG